MKISQAIAFLAASFFASLNYGAAPDTLEGLTYHEAFNSAWIVTTESTIRFDGASRFEQSYSVHRFAQGIRGTNGPGNSEKNVWDPIGYGSFTYLKTGENTAELTLVYSKNSDYPFLTGTGKTTVRHLVFDGANFGQVESYDEPLPPGKLIIANSLFSLVAAENPEVNAARLNSSTRCELTQKKSVIFGFSVSGRQRREVLIRVIGPGLAPFGIKGTCSDPTFTLRGSDGGVIGTHSDASWSADANGAQQLRLGFKRFGAFALAEDSLDKADLLQLPPGNYTVEAFPNDSSTTGEALIEVYEGP